MIKINTGALVAAIVLLSFPLVGDAEKPVSAGSYRVAGEKLDSGLDALPHYREWKDGLAMDTIRLPGEKLDSGLGSLPPYSQWPDHSLMKRASAAR